MVTHFGQQRGILPVHLELLQQAGVTSIRDEVYWGGVEREKGTLRIVEHQEEYVQAAIDAGFEPMLILDYGNRHYQDGNKPTEPQTIAAFTEYARFVVEHFRGRVKLYEVWNEWDIGIGVPNKENGTAEDYLRLIESVTPAIKAVDPDITVIGGVSAPYGLGSGWFQATVEGGLLNFCDAVSIHTYNYAQEPDKRTPEGWAATVNDIVEMLRENNGGNDVPLYITEMGWPTHVGKAETSAVLSGAYLARLYLLARTMPSIRGVWWYDFQDDGYTRGYNEDNFGMIRPGHTPKPSYHALRAIAQPVRSATSVRHETIADGRVSVLWLTMPDGGETLALWSTDDRPARVVLTRPGAATGDASVQLEQVGYPPVTMPWGFRSHVQPRTLEQDKLVVQADALPVLIRGDLRGVEVAFFPVTPADSGDQP